MDMQLFINIAYVNAHSINADEAGPPDDPMAHKREIFLLNLFQRSKNSVRERGYLLPHHVIEVIEDLD